LAQSDHAAGQREIQSPPTGGWDQSAKVQSGKWALALLFLVDGAGFGTWAAHVAVFKQELQLANSSLTLVLLCVIGGAILTMPVTGQIIAHSGSHRVARVVAILYFLAIALLGEARSLRHLLLFAFFFGAAKGAFDVTLNAAVFAVERLYRRSSQGLLQGAWSCGGLLGAVASSLMLRCGGTIRTDLSFAAVTLGFCACIALPRMIPGTPGPATSKKHAWQDATLLRISAIAFFGLMSEGAIADWASVYLHTVVRVSLSLSAIGYGAFSVTMALSRFSNDWMVRRFSARQILQASGILIACGIGCTLAVPLWWPAIFGFVVAGIGVATVVPVTFSIAGRNAKTSVGPAISTIATIGYFGFLAGPPLIGSLAVLVGLQGALIVVIIAGLFITAAPALIFLDSRKTTASKRDQPPVISV
jgi:MFS family permease